MNSTDHNTDLSEIFERRISDEPSPATEIQAKKFAHKLYSHCPRRLPERCEDLNEISFAVHRDPANSSGNGISIDPQIGLTF